MADKNIVTDRWEEYTVTDPNGAVSSGFRKVGTMVEGKSKVIDNPPATEAAAELAKEQDIVLSTIKGTGKDGIITKPDVEAAIEARGNAGS